jgi:TolB protein
MVRNPVFEADGGHLWWESSAQGFRDLYRAARDGSEVQRRVAHPAGNYEPDPHPRSGDAVFVSSRDGQAELYLASADGAEPVRWTEAAGDDMAPRWIPGTDRVAFLTTREGRKRLWTRAESGRTQPLLPTGVGEHEAFVWSPTGDAVALTTLPRPGRVQVDVVGLDGGLRWSWTDPARVAFPAWSPDGRWLVASVGEETSATLVVRDAAGGRGRALPTPPGSWLPRWVPMP